MTALTLLDDELKIEESAHKGSITTALEVGNLKDLADITVSVLKEKMYLEGLAGKKCLIDGFPLSQVSTQFPDAARRCHISFSIVKLRCAIQGSQPQG